MNVLLQRRLACMEKQLEAMQCRVTCIEEWSVRSRLTSIEAQLERICALLKPRSGEFNPAEQAIIDALLVRAKATAERAERLDAMIDPLLADVPPGLIR